MVVRDNKKGKFVENSWRYNKNIKINRWTYYLLSALRLRWFIYLSKPSNTSFLLCLPSCRCRRLDSWGVRCLGVAAAVCTCQRSLADRSVCNWNLIPVLDSRNNVTLVGNWQLFRIRSSLTVRCCVCWILKCYSGKDKLRRNWLIY